MMWCVAGFRASTRRAQCTNNADFPLAMAPLMSSRAGAAVSASQASSSPNSVARPAKGTGSPGVP
jgi:hypothetical protein